MLQSLCLCKWNTCLILRDREPLPLLSWCQCADFGGAVMRHPSFVARSGARLRPQLPARGRGLSACQPRAQRQPLPTARSLALGLMNLSWRARRLFRHTPQGRCRPPAPAAEPENGGGGGGSRGGQGAAPGSKPESKPQQVREHG